MSDFKTQSPGRKTVVLIVIVDQMTPAGATPCGSPGWEELFETEPGLMLGRPIAKTAWRIEPACATHGIPSPGTAVRITRPCAPEAQTASAAAEEPPLAA